MFNQPYPTNALVIVDINLNTIYEEGAVVLKEDDEITNDLRKLVVKDAKQKIEKSWSTDSKGVVTSYKGEILSYNVTVTENDIIPEVTDTEDNPERKFFAFIMPSPLPNI